MTFDWELAALHIPNLPEPREVVWRRVSKARRCPICDHPDWCTVSDDGALVCCMRVPSDRASRNRMGGWIHRTGAAPQAPPERFWRPRVAATPGESWLDCAAILRPWQAGTTPPMLTELAATLGVSAGSLSRLGAVWAPAYRAWAFPMRDTAGKVVGIRLRSPAGEKWAVRGSHEGLFIPEGLRDRTLLLVVEGPTDAAAALDLEQDAIGRPSCTGAVDLLRAYLRQRARRDVAIVADHDPWKPLPNGTKYQPGADGARRLADAIVGVCRLLKVIDTRPHKDVREWRRQGATAAQLLARYTAAYPWQHYQRQRMEGPSHGR